MNAGSTARQEEELGRRDRSGTPEQQQYGAYDRILGERPEGSAAFGQDLVPDRLDPPGPGRRRQVSPGDRLLRYKGILAIPREDRKLIFQGVQRVAGFDYGEGWAPGEARVSRIVLIGRNLPAVRLREDFLGTAAPEPG